MKGKAWIFLLLFIAGFLILLFPDNGKRVLILNEQHGPSLQDVIGLAMMLMAWLYSCVIIAKNVRYLRNKLGDGRLVMFISIYLLSIFGICISLGATNNIFLWLFVIPATLINLLLIFLAFSKKEAYR